MTTLLDRIHEDPAPLAVQVTVPLADLRILIDAALDELTLLAGECETVATARHSTGPGFLSPEAARAQGELVRKERAAQHENRMLALKLTGPVPAPTSVAAVSLVAEIDTFVSDFVDDLHRRLHRAGACHIREPWRGNPARARLPRHATVDYARELLALYTRPAELRRVHAGAEDLTDRARRFLDGNRTIAHDDPCPWCGHLTLVARLDESVIRCESDRHTGRRLPCVCSDSYCPCRTQPTAHRHQWHRDVLKPDPAPGEPKHRLRSQTWDGLRDLLNDRARQHATKTPKE